MNDINELFFQLIRVAIGTQETLSRAPSVQEWKALYKMAKKQSLVGICFAGVQRLGSPIEPLEQRSIEPFELLQTYWNLSEIDYLRWMGMAAKIQQRNERVNAQCVELQQMLAADGFRSCILKGQGNAALYKCGGSMQQSCGSSSSSSSKGLSGSPSEAFDPAKPLTQAERLNHLHNEREASSLSLLRQSGDIDVWVDGPKDKVLEWARAHGSNKVTGDLHVDCKVFSDTAVELHFIPSIASSPKVNKRLQEWFEEQKQRCFTSPIPFQGGGNNEGIEESLEPGEALELAQPLNLPFQVPPLEFNLVYLMHHMFRHYLYEGIGLRQVLDYYFVLRASYEERKTKNENPSNPETLKLLKHLKLLRFAGALTWVIGYVFEGNPEYYKSFPLGEDSGEAPQRGRRLLEVIMEGGNFGHGTKKYKVTGWNKPWTRLSRYVRRNWYLLQDYPDEIVWNVIKKIKCAK